MSISFVSLITVIFIIHIDNSIIGKPLFSSLLTAFSHGSSLSSNYHTTFAALRHRNSLSIAEVNSKFSSRYRASEIQVNRENNEERTVLQKDLFESEQRRAEQKQKKQETKPHYKMLSYIKSSDNLMSHALEAVRHLRL